VDDTTLLQPLTARETDVLRLIARGATNREIAHRTCTSARAP
jgi:DNA-binding NarL/FixJ family response regulator